MRTEISIGAEGVVSETFDLTIQAGDDNELVVTWLPDGVAPELTGATAEMILKWDAYRPAGGVAGVAAGEVRYSSEDDPATITLDDADGTISVVMSAASTASIPPADARFQLRVTDVSSVKTTVARGMVIVNRNLFGD